MNICISTYHILYKYEHVLRVYGCVFIAITRKSRVLDVVYNASNNELVRTKTLVKNCIVQIDSTPFKQWLEALLWFFLFINCFYRYEMHYGLPLGHKRSKAAKEVRNLLQLSVVACCSLG